MAEKKKVTINEEKNVVISPSPDNDDQMDGSPTVSVEAAAVATIATAASVGFFNGYFNVFGFEISKTTVWIAVFFILLIGLYMAYRYWYANKETIVKKGSKQVSFEEQHNEETEEDEDEEVDEKDKKKEDK